MTTGDRNYECTAKHLADQQYKHLSKVTLNTFFAPAYKRTWKTCLQILKMKTKPDWLVSLASSVGMADKTSLW